MRTYDTEEDRLEILKEREKFIKDNKDSNNLYYSDSMEIRKILHTQHLKYTYYLLSVTIAAIGFAITQTVDTKLSIMQLPLGIAVGSWAVSFLYGFLSRKEIIKIFNNVVSPTLIDPSIGHTLDKNIENSKSQRFENIQLLAFILGILAYLIWHIIVMYQNRVA